MMDKGRFISFEGIDGAGKSTHLSWLADYLRAQQISVVVSREPGGTALGEQVRRLLLADTQIHAETEALLVFAARRQHLAEIIEPALLAGKWVLCDRFSDASYAYQGGGRGIAEEKLAILEAWVQQREYGLLQPDLTLLFDLPLQIARQRLQHERCLDRFEREQNDFFARVRENYLQRAQMARFRVIDAQQPLAAIRQQLLTLVAPLLPVVS